jgi:hypothetical protein
MQGNNIPFIETYPGGSGHVTNITLENFRSKASLYGSDINSIGKMHLSPTQEPLLGVILSSRTSLVFMPSNHSRTLRLTIVKQDLSPMALRDPLASSLLTIYLLPPMPQSKISAFGPNLEPRSLIYGLGDDSYGKADGIKPLGSGQSPTPYTNTYSVTAKPTGWAAPSLPTWAASSTGYGSECFYHYLGCMR